MQYKNIYNKDIYDDELYHYGRKGMKWGQHIFGDKRGNKSGHISGSKMSKEQHYAERERRKRLSAAQSDAELRKLTKKSNSRKDIEKHTALYNEIADHVISFEAQRTPRTGRTKALFQKLDQAAAKKDYDTFDKLAPAMDEAVLKDLGYAVTPFARTAIREMWYNS